MLTTLRFFSVMLLLVFSGVTYSAMITRGPYLQMGTHHSIIMRWRTDVSTNSVVYYGNTSSNLDKTVSVSEIVTDHEVLISGLDPLSQYFYAVGDDTVIHAGGDNSYRFTTSPAENVPSATRIWMIGDSGTADSNAYAVYNAYLNHQGSESTNLWIMLGDNAYDDGTDKDYQSAVFEMYPELLRRTPLWTTLGNHDGYSADSSSESGPYYDIFSLPRNAEAGGLASGTEAYYSFDYGEIHFIGLDSYDTDRSDSGAMMTWLENDLVATQKKWVIAYWHHPPYSNSTHDSDTERALIDMRENALPILERYGVDLVFSGHSHSYERSFFINGNYGSSSTFNSTHIIDNCDGHENGGGAYQSFKSGTVYTVAGASGLTDPGPLNHPAMFTSQNELGSVILDINNDRIDVKYLNSVGKVTDYYTMVKGPDSTPPKLSKVNNNGKNEVIMTFCEKVDTVSASNVTNYNINNGVGIVAADVSDNTVSLTTSTLSKGIEYTLTINNVKDKFDNPISVNTKTHFNYLNTLTKSFQNGNWPNALYGGVEDTFIADENPDTNYDSLSTILADGYDDPLGELVGLIKWDLSTIPYGATITKVEIEFEVYNPSYRAYNLYESVVDWSENTATWNNINPYSNRGALVGSFVPSSSEMHRITLSSEGISMVQNWLNSKVNNGILLMTDGTTDGLDILSSENDISEQSPRLIVTYAVVSNNTIISPTILFLPAILYLLDQ